MKSIVEAIPQQQVHEASSKHAFKYLPAYTRFIRDQHLTEYVNTLLDLARANNVPVLKYFETYPADQVFEIARQSAHEFLTWIADGRTEEQIADAVARWQGQKLPAIGSVEITMDDLTLISYTRRKTLISLLPLYTTDFMHAVLLLNELEDYFKEADTAFSQTYIHLLERQLRSREDQLLEAQSIAGVGNFLWNPATMQGEVSPVVMEILELTPGAGMEGFITHVHPEDRAKFHQAIEEAARHGKPLDVEYRYLIGDQEKVIWSRGNVADDKGQVVIRGTVMDVTERHAILRRLQESDRLYKQAQERARIGNFVWNLQTNEVFWSDELYRIYGLDPQGEKITYAKYVDMLQISDRTVLLEQIEKVIATGVTLDFNFHITTPGGSRKILNIKAELEKDGNGLPFSFNGTIQDVTDIQQLVDKLQESDKLYKQAQASTHIGNWKWDLLTNEVTWSDEMYRIYGLPFDADLSYENYIKRIHPDYVEARQQQVQKALETCEPMEYHYRIIRPDGGERILHTRLEVITDAEGKPLQMVGTCQDVTEKQLLIERLQKSEEELQRKNQELEVSNSNLQEFAYVASHDLKEPLRKISTFGEMLFQFTQDNLSEKGRFYVEKMVEGSKRMQHMIDELLSFAVISRNKSFTATNLNDVLQKVVADLEVPISEKQATIRASELPVVQVVASQFEQLFLNLIGNSLKFSKEGVPPVITITHQVLGSEEVDRRNLFPRLPYLAIQFADNGIGFEQEYAEKIFGMFQRLHGKVDYAGSGIGLSVCRKIMENHGGTITATGIPQAGATFEILLPLH